MCPKGNQSDADKQLCHIQHIFLAFTSHTPPSWTSLQISLIPLLSSAFEIRSVPSPGNISLLTASHFASPLQSAVASKPSSLPCHELAASLPPSFLILWLSEPDSHVWRLEPEIHTPPGLHHSFGLSLDCFHWLFHANDFHDFYPCFLSCLFSHPPFLSSPQPPSLKFPFLKYSSSLKAFIINLSRNYVRDSSTMLWFIHCVVVVFLVDISQELRWSSFYLHC